MARLINYAILLCAGFMLQLAQPQPSIAMDCAVVKQNCQANGQCYVDAGAGCYCMDNSYCTLAGKCSPGATCNAGQGCKFDNGCVCSKGGGHYCKVTNDTSASRSELCARAMKTPCAAGQTRNTATCQCVGAGQQPNVIPEVAAQRSALSAAPAHSNTKPSSASSSASSSSGGMCAARACTSGYAWSSSACACLCTRSDGCKTSSSSSSSSSSSGVNTTTGGGTCAVRACPTGFSWNTTQCTCVSQPTGSSSSSSSGNDPRCNNLRCAAPATAKYQGGTCSCVNPSCPPTRATECAQGNGTFNASSCTCTPKVCTAADRQACQARGQLMNNTTCKCQPTMSSTSGGSTTGSGSGTSSSGGAGPQPPAGYTCSEWVTFATESETMACRPAPAYVLQYKESGNNASKRTQRCCTKDSLKKDPGGSSSSSSSSGGTVQCGAHRSVQTCSEAGCTWDPTTRGGTCNGCPYAIGQTCVREGGTVRYDSQGCYCDKKPGPGTSCSSYTNRAECPNWCIWEVVTDIGSGSPTWAYCRAP